MSKGNAKSRYNFEKDYCEYENDSWCNLPKYKRCEHCLRLINGDKACYVRTLSYCLPIEE